MASQDFGPLARAVGSRLGRGQAEGYGAGGGIRGAMPQGPQQALQGALGAFRGWNRQRAVGGPGGGDLGTAGGNVERALGRGGFAGGQPQPEMLGGQPMISRGASPQDLQGGAEGVAPGGDNGYEAAKQARLGRRGGRQQPAPQAPPQQTMPVAPAPKQVDVGQNMNAPGPRALPVAPRTQPGPGRGFVTNGPAFGSFGAGYGG